MEEIVEVLKMRGHIRMVLGDAQGNPIEERNFFNLCVTQGRSWVLGQLNTVNQVTSQTLTYIAIGSSTVAPTTADTALNAEIVRNAIGTFVTSTLTLNPPSLQMLVSFATNQGNTTLAECGVFNSNAAGTMLAHATFTSFVKATSNTLNITYTISD
jgi:hydrogenase maturation factor